MKNSGKSAAFIEDLIINSRFEKATAHLPETPAYVPGNPITPGPVLSNGVITVRAMPDGMHGEPQMLFNETDIVAIKSGTFTFYIFGYISFTDEFTLLKAKRTGFCALYNPELPINSTPAPSAHTLTPTRATISRAFFVPSVVTFSLTFVPVYVTTRTEIPLVKDVGGDTG